MNLNPQLSRCDLLMVDSPATMPSISSISGLVRRMTDKTEAAKSQNEEAYGKDDVAVGPSTDIAHAGAASVASASQAAGPMSGADLAERFWEKAYSNLKDSESLLMASYERILSSVLSQGAFVPGDDTSPREQRLQIIRIARESIVRQDGSKLLRNLEFDQVESVILERMMTPMLRLSPGSALPWATVCVALSFIQSASSRSRTTFMAIAIIASRMEWYWSLPSAMVSLPLDGPHQGVEQRIVRIYQYLLLYQVETALLNVKSREVAHFLDYARMSDWHVLRDEIKAAEKELVHCLEPYDGGMLRRCLDEAQLKSSSMMRSMKIGIQEARLGQMEEAETRVLEALRPVALRRILDESESLIVPGTCEWLLKHPAFQEWLHRDRGILWIQGPPGMGKTVLTARVIRFLESQMVTSEENTTAFFFLRFGDVTLNDVLAVQRNLVYQLAIQNTGLVPHIIEAYDRDGPAFADVPERLSEVLIAILREPAVGDVCLIIDALDECSEGAPTLLDLMDLTAAKLGSRIRWLVTSRENLDKARFTHGSHVRELQLTRQQIEVSSDIDLFIDKMLTAVMRERVKNEEEGKGLRAKLLERFQSKSNGSFIQARLWMNILQKPHWNEELKPTLESLPLDLEVVYANSVAQIENLETQTRDNCFSVLSAVAVAYRPFHVTELPVLSGHGGRFAAKAVAGNVIKQCALLLEVRNNTILVLHKSVSDFLKKSFLSGRLGSTHFDIFSRSLGALNQVFSTIRPIPVAGHSTRLMPGYLDSLHYSCVYWVDHLCAAVDAGIDEERLITAKRDLSSFLSEHLLRWFEGLSHLRSLSEGVRAVRLLLRRVRELDGPDSELSLLLDDAEVLLNVFFSVIYQYPGQVYGAPLVFSPSANKVHGLFRRQCFSFVKNFWGIRSHFDGCLKVLEGHTSSVKSVAFSPQDFTLLSGSSDHTIILWDSVAGVHLRTYHVHAKAVLSVAFVPGNPVFVSASSDKTIMARDIVDKEQRMIATSTVRPKAMAISPIAPRLVAVSKEPAVRLFDLDSGQCIFTRNDFDCHVNAATFSPEGTAFALALHDGTVQIRDTYKGEIVHTLAGGHSSAVFAVAFSPDTELLASASHDKSVIIWKLSSSAIMKRLEDHTGAVFAVAFSPDGRMLVSASSDTTVRVWDPYTGHHLRTLEGHRDWVNSVAFSSDGRLFATASHDKTVRIWDAEIISGLTRVPNANDGHIGAVREVAFSPDGKVLASISSDKTVKIWDSVTGAVMHTLEGHIGSIRAVAFSLDSTRLTSASNDKTVRVWEIATGESLQTLTGHTRRVNSAVFSADGTKVASASNDMTVRIWDAATGECIRPLRGHVDWVTTVTLSPDAFLVAAAASDRTVYLWEAQNGSPIRRFDIHQLVTSLAFSADSRHLRAGGRWFDTTVGIPIQESQPEEPVMRTCLKEDWVTRDGEKVLWLPPDYRPTCSTAYGDLHALGLSSGRVTFLEFEWPVDVTDLDPVP